MYDRVKCVKLSPPIIHDYLYRRNATSFDKIMTKEEEETASDDEEEHYEEVLSFMVILVVEDNVDFWSMLS